MNELDTRLDQAAHDLRTAVEELELQPLSPRRRRSMAAGPVMVTLVVAAVAGAVVFAASRDATTGSLADRAGAAQADDQLAADVIEIAAQHGWQLTVGDGPGVRRAYSTAAGGYVEVRARSTEASDTLLVSISVNNPQGVAAGTEGRSGLLRTVGTARVYVGTDSRSARAVELFNDTTIVYVRSESNAGTARSLEDLADIAVAIDNVWATRTVTYPDRAADHELDAAPQATDPDTARFFERVEALYRPSESSSDPAADNALQTDVDTCMSSQGRTYLAPAIPVPVEPRAYTGSWWRLADVGLAERIGYGYAMFAGGPEDNAARAAMVWYWSDPPPSYLALSHAARLDYDQAVEWCFGQSLRTPGRTGEPGRSVLATDRQAVGSLTAAFYEVILSDQFEPIRDQWDACVRRHGVQPTRRDQYDLVEEAERAVLTITNRTNATDRTGDDMLSALDAERPITIADATCKAELAADTATLLSPVLDAWSAVHDTDRDPAVPIEPDT